MKRRAEAIEQEELEGGEINLIPYLDIVTNLMLFLLASISAGLILGQINTTLPDRGPPPDQMTDKPDTKPDDKPLGLIVTISDKDIRVFAERADAGLGDLKNPHKRFPVLPPKIDPKTDQLDPVPVFDFKALNKTMYDIAARWNDKPRAFQTYRILLVADPATPYGTIIPVMDAMRCKIPDTAVLEPCVLPRLARGEDGKPQLDANNKPILIGADGKALKGNYNPDTMALFHDIVFSPGFQ